MSFNVLPSTDSILAQALPGSLSAPQGWRSEILDSSSPTADDIETNLITGDTSYFEKYEEYQTLNTSDAPPIIFSSINEANRVVNEIPSSTILPSRTANTKSTNEYCNTTIRDSSSHEQKTFVTKDQQNCITNINDRQEPPPLILHKTLPNNTVTYQQNVSVRYLQPPSPPPPGPIIIREIRPPPPPAQSPVQIRQRPPPPPTPPPIVIRERPPPTPPRLPSHVVEKLLSPPPRLPRRMIVERFAECPPKPPDVIVERWLPYRQSERRRILFERVPQPYIPRQEPNLLILHGQPHARIYKEFINHGVTRADPLTYLQRYGPEINSWHTNSQYAYLVDEATRALPPPHPVTSMSDHHEYYGSYSNRYPSSPVPHISHVWDRMRSASPILSPTPYPYDLSHRYSIQSPLHYNDYAPYRGDTRTMVDVTPSWIRNCNSRLPSYSFSPAYPPRSMQVNSDGELRHVLSGLTNDHVPLSYRSY